MTALEKAIQEVCKERKISEKQLLKRIPALKENVGEPAKS